MNLTLDSAYMHVFVPVEALIWIRSIAIVLLIVAHAMRHVEIQKVSAETGQQQPATLTLTPELIEALRLFLSQTSVSEQQQETHEVAETA